MGLWSKWHLFTVPPAFIVFTIVAVFMAKGLKNKDEKIRYLPFQIITIVILALEVAKQIYSCIGGYNLYSLPFHYCSLFLYLLPFHSFYKGKYKKLTDTLTFGCCSSLFFFMWIMPAIVYGEGAIQSFTSNFMSFHTVIFHNLVCLYFLLMLTMKAYELYSTKKDLKVLGVFFGGYVIVAAILSNVLQVNFHNLYRCNVGFIEEIRAAIVAEIGWVGQLIYVAALFVLTILFAYLAYFAVKLILYLIGKISKKKAK